MHLSGTRFGFGAKHLILLPKPFNTIQNDKLIEYANSYVKEKMKSATDDRIRIHSSLFTMTAHAMVPILVYGRITKRTVEESVADFFHQVMFFNMQL